MELESICFIHFKMTTGKHANKDYKKKTTRIEGNN